VLPHVQFEQHHANSRRPAPTREHCFLRDSPSLMSAPGQSRLRTTARNAIAVHNGWSSAIQQPEGRWGILRIHLVVPIGRTGPIPSIVPLSLRTYTGDGAAPRYWRPRSYKGRPTTCFNRGF